MLKNGVPAAALVVALVLFQGCAGNVHQLHKGEQGWERKESWNCAAEIGPDDRGGWEVVLRQWLGTLFRLHLPDGLEEGRTYPCRVTRVEWPGFPELTAHQSVRVTKWEPEGPHLSGEIVGGMGMPIRFEGSFRARPRGPGSYLYQPPGCGQQHGRGWLFNTVELTRGDQGGWVIELAQSRYSRTTFAYSQFRIHLPNGIEEGRSYSCRVVRFDDGLFKSRTKEVDEALVLVKAWRPERSYLSLEFVGGMGKPAPYEGYIKTR
ncbi:MAG: hypothetical protein O7C98_00735 [Planctomycetota bacterium]|nr:hypothetical protein [Planctomycetota bacterium]